MKVGICIAGLLSGNAAFERTDGGATYGRCFVDAIAQVDSDNEYIVFVFEEEINYLTYIQQPNIKIVGIRRLTPLPFLKRATRKLLRIVNLWPLLRVQARKYNVDFIHFVVLQPQEVDNLDVFSPYILSQDDVHHEFYPEHFDKSTLDYRKRCYRPWTEKATKLITFSKFARWTIVTKYGIPKERFTVIYHGKGEQFAQEIDRSEVMRVQSKYDLPERFLFYPATALTHKNHVTLLKAMHLLAERGFKYDLILAGAEHHNYKVVRDCIVSLGLHDHVCWLGSVSQRDMPALYHASTLMVFPSRYEGFGLPLIEAMACGCPVICSNAACLPEIAGGAALLVEPSDIEGMANAIQKVMTDDALREGLINRGFERASIFSWYETARKAIEVYQDMAELQR